jgi:hypothetical protein
MDKLREHDGSMCAHLRVKYNPIDNDNGTSSDRWTCNLCGHEFWPRQWLFPAPWQREAALRQQTPAVGEVEIRFDEVQELKERYLKKGYRTPELLTGRMTELLEIIHAKVGQPDTPPTPPDAPLSPAKCAQCGAPYSDKWIGTTCSVCDGEIVLRATPSASMHEDVRVAFEKWREIEWPYAPNKAAAVECAFEAGWLAAKQTPPTPREAGASCPTCGIEWEYHNDIKCSGDGHEYAMAHFYKGMFVGLAAGQTSGDALREALEHAFVFIEAAHDWMHTTKVRPLPEFLASTAVYKSAVQAALGKTSSE